MSKYENYNEVSSCYDEGRYPAGADIIAGLLHVHGGKPLKDLHVLDAGCGTGSYTKALIELGVSKITLLDACPKMLTVAKDKLKDAIDKKIIDEVVEATLPAIPFEDGSFDVVLYTMVLHHVDNTANGKDFPIMEEMFRETKRVLRPKGIMVISEPLPYTQRNSVWYHHLHEDLSDRWCKKFPTIKQYEAMFDKCGFQIFSKLNILGLDLIKQYFDPEGPLKKEWRRGSSYWGFATEEEILDIEKTVRRMNENGTMNDFIRDHDSSSETGVAAIVACRSL